MSMGQDQSSVKKLETCFASSRMICWRTEQGKEIGCEGMHLPDVLNLKYEESSDSC